MKIDNTDAISQLIQELDTFLYEGYLLKTHKIDEWNIKSKQEGNKPDINEYKLDFEKQINAWLNEVATVLFNQFKEKHPYFHFVHPKSDALTSGHPLGDLASALGRHLFALEDIIIRLEERRNLAIRQEIAEKESQADVLYVITYSEYTRLIKINNIVLGKPDFGSENDICFNYLYLNPNRPVPIQELEKANDKALKKRLSDIVRDLGFTGKFKTVFFPVIEKNKIMFTNPITKQFAQKHDLPALDFSKIGRQMEIKVDKGRNNEK